MCWPLTRTPNRFPIVSLRLAPASPFVECPTVVNALSISKLAALINHRRCPCRIDRVESISVQLSTCTTVIYTQTAHITPKQCSSASRQVHTHTHYLTMRDSVVRVCVCEFVSECIPGNPSSSARRSHHYTSGQIRDVKHGDQTINAPTNSSSSIQHQKTPFEHLGDCDDSYVVLQTYMLQRVARARIQRMCAIARARNYDFARGALLIKIIA